MGETAKILQRVTLATTTFGYSEVARAASPGSAGTLDRAGRVTSAGLSEVPMRMDAAKAAAAEAQDALAAQQAIAEKRRLFKPGTPQGSALRRSTQISATPGSALGSSLAARSSLGGG